MHNSAATLEERGHHIKQRHAAMPKELVKLEGGSMKFAYATGARPLDGYTIKRGIGVGGFGEVYFALSDAGKELAVKRIQRNMDVEVRGVTQCINLKHPNLVSLYDIKYDDEGQAWVVMEYVSGDSLKDALDRNPNGMPFSEVYDWFQGIARGVAYLHDQGIVHRDLKPGNIFLDGDIVKIGDYGLSKYISCSRRSGQTESVGTFHYMAPEIGKGVYGKEIDVYALGIILFELLTGRVPFDGESTQEIIMKHLTAEPDLSPVPEAFRSVIRRSLLKDPAQRISSVGEMLVEVEIAAGLAKPRPAVTAAKPPVIAKAASNQHATSTMYIGEEVESDGIYLGPLQESVAGESPFASRPKSRPPQAEPIAQAVRDGLRSTTNWWQHSNLNSSAKVLLLIGGICLLVLNGQWLVPTGILLGAIYLVYFGLRSIVLALDTPQRKPNSQSDVSPRTHGVSASMHKQRRTYRRKHWKQEIREQLARKHNGERVTELSGAMITSAVASLILCFVMTLFMRGEALADVFTWTLYAWLSLTCIVGAWMILAVAKFWEADEGEPLRRRFVMLAAGLLTGVVAFATSQFLGVQVTDELVVQTLPAVSISTNWTSSDGSLALPAFLIYFGGIFGITKWWLQADPLRTSRISLWSTAGCVFWAWLIQIFWAFPQPWGFMFAACTSIAVQLAAPWVRSSERARVREQISEVA
ncbi:MAG: serine/threonine protein kinase [Planctomycetia bacterium]|nr:serine/threonine protein kinase [Planctomycetia bacterium]